MEGVQKSERPFIVHLLKTRLIYSHTDYTCNISLKGGMSFGGRRQGRISVGRKDLCLSIYCSSVKKTHKLIDTHTDHACDISLKGGKEEGV